MAKNQGQPTKYKEEYCELLIEHMNQGLSYESFAGAVGASRQALYDWEKVHEEFAQAKEIAWERSRVFWEKLGIDHILNTSESTTGIGSSSKSLNASVWIFNMKNRFGWRDKQPDEHDTVINNNTVGADVSDDELDRRIAEKLKHGEKE